MSWIVQKVSVTRKSSILSLIILLFSGLIFYLSTRSSPEIQSFDLTCNYILDATLDPFNKQLVFTEQAQVRNDGQAEISELYFHLYGNLYQTETESIKVMSITDNNARTIMFEMLDNEQLILITLNDKLTSGTEISLHFFCEVFIPPMEDRYGIARDGEIHMPFFYPQLAVISSGGWNTDSMSKIGDGRYSDVSDYTLRIGIPSEYEIICSGNELSRETVGSVTKYFFQANSRRDIVIFAFNDYVKIERTVGNTRLLGYFNKRKSKAAMELVMDAAAFSMAYYNRTLIEYPYETLVITNRAWGTGGASSMEYSGAITVAFSDDDPSNGESYDTVVFHEVAHQWFYSLVGNNENTEPWLDESFATFFTWLCFTEWVNTKGEENSIVEDYWEGIIRIGASYVEGIPVNSSSDEVDVYTLVFYNRGACFLRELMEVIGRDAFIQILSNYCNLYAFDNATTQDFISLLREQTPICIDELINEYISM